jgi:sugar/nucleoside kinase (ribokinase family)
LTPKVRLDGTSLTPKLLQSRSFHAVCSPRRIIDIVTQLKQRREKECGTELPSPVIVWEPVPDLCIPDELENCYKAMKLVDVLSPNHAELSSFFGHDTDQLSSVEKHAKAFVASGIGPDGNGTIVVRCGKVGCFAAGRENIQWFPAYHTKETGKVVDPTGGGNTFLGGLTVALARGKSIEEACIWGSIAASFAIEQIGMPKLTESDECERWNEASVWDRVDEFRRELM